MMPGAILPPAPAAAAHPARGGGTGLRHSPVGRWAIPCACPAAPLPPLFVILPCETCQQGIEVCACTCGVADEATLAATLRDLLALVAKRGNSLAILANDCGVALTAEGCDLSRPLSGPIRWRREITAQARAARAVEAEIQRLIYGPGGVLR